MNQMSLASSELQENDQQLLVQLNEDEKIIQLNAKSVSELIKQLEEETAAQQKVESKEFASLEKANKAESKSLDGLQKDLDTEAALVKKTDALQDATIKELQKT